MMRTVIVAGGTGFIGRELLRALQAQRWNIVLLTRRPEAAVPAGSPIQKVVWDGKTLGKWRHELDGAEAVINLAGESIAAKRWTDKQKQKIITSRCDSTAVLAQAIQQCQRPPKLWINGSAVGFYGNVPEGEVTEESPRGEGFLAETCDQWEAAARPAQSHLERLVFLRTGIVLARGGGALEKMVPPFQFFAGGPLGSGKQWMPWIHRDDLVRIILFILEHREIEGAVNGVAPHPIRMKEFCSILGNALKRPSWAPVPAAVLKLLLGKMAEEMLLSGQKVIPKKIHQTGFVFLYPSLKEALRSIFKK